MLEFRPIEPDSPVMVGTVLKLNDGTLCVVGNVVGKFKYEVGEYYTENKKEQTHTFGLVKLSDFGTAYDYSQEELVRPDFEFLQNDNWNCLSKECPSGKYWRWPVEFCNYVVEELEKHV